jgi:chemotaxis response regulator CheB
MKSAAEVFRDACRGVLISGTGTDGLDGMRRVKERLGEVYVQDKQSAVANQLVSAAIAAGIPSRQLQIPEIVELFN